MSHTVVTTSTTTTTSRSGTAGCLNLGYSLSTPGILKIAQMVALLIAFLCVHLARAWTAWSAFCYFEVVTLWFLIAFLIFFLLYIFRLQGKIPCINWVLTEFLHYAVGTILVFIASIVVAVKSSGLSELVAGSVFGFIATFLMALSLWMSYKVTFSSQQTGAAV
ncbi:CKLF-like MARVEL transmembrane domain-containing protein 7 [Lampris incognitus]|uniref:CKLF-like MARVEL transmembrane domain-containing protein 7 n=1 Tax=Lampris incognitus TaxID=2546036 RepID=UPI0024B5FF6C|nr:CKLF-like MARVEL transmembrane domain-containing protein 7 [Lampris incognitus]